MIKKDMEKINFNNEMSETLAVTANTARGGALTLSFKSLFHKISSTVSTTSLWSLIAMNKQYMTSLSCQYELLISPFNNRYLGCSGVLQAVEKVRCLVP